MPLTPEQQAQLDELQAKATEPPHRTRTGVAGVLHALVETVSGQVAHRSPEEWAQLADQAEQAAGDGGGESGEQPAWHDEAGEDESSE